MRNVLVLGGIGQLGSCIQKLTGLQRGEYQYHFLDETKGNILDEALLEKLFGEYQPAYVVNCAAYTAVDLAEDQFDIADAVNHLGAKNIAEACKSHEVILLHVSTDFIFEGNSFRPLKEEDAANPISVYGKTKLDGELAIITTLQDYFIIRTSWLYSEFGQNFVKTMIKLGKGRDELGVIGDQVGTPTYAVDLADLIVFIIENRKTNFGVYHFSNEGVASWYDFAHEIFELAGIELKLNALTTEDYPTKAKRPPYSVMSKVKVKKELGYDVPNWRKSLKQCINAIKEQQ
ncbi:MAG: dTDP-4-dehydrorhamnose reductase [Glaciecola sp.]|jgi:dTDP-4-dehydrorhamnose reductase